MNSKQNTLSRVSQIMIYTTVATWVKWQPVEGVIIYRIMIICTNFHSNLMLFSYVTEDSTFFVCWCNEQLKGTMNSKGNTLNRVSQIIIHTTVATWV